MIKEKKTRHSQLFRSSMASERIALDGGTHRHPMRYFDYQ